MIKTPLIKLEKNHSTQILFWVLNIITLFAVWFILFPSNNLFYIFIFLFNLDHPKWYYAISSSLIGAKMYASYIMATRKDPGSLKSDEDLDFLDLLQKFDATELCPDC